MAFKKGQGGRPKGAKNVAAKEVREIIDALAGPNCERYFQRLHEIADGQHADIHARLKAIQLLLDRRLGKVKEHVELSGDVNLRTRVVHEYHAQ